jgi:hypothetical protein
MLGRLRHRWRRRAAPVYELSPVALGVPIATEAEAEVAAADDAPGAESGPSRPSP